MGVKPVRFEEVFRQVTGAEPYDYQRELAMRAEPPALLNVPTGSGKTLATLLPWLLDAEAPLRLVYALPMRSLVEQTVRVARHALEALDDDTPVHVLMGGVDPMDWRKDADRSAILIGTIDMLLSRALNRGYAESRFAWPVAFGLLNNDCRWIFDEVQLMGPARSTSAQLAGLRRKLGVLRGCQTTWMSATVDREALETVDHPALGDEVHLSEADRAGPLKARLEATKRVERIDLVNTPPAQLALRISEAVADHHRRGRRTLVVLNRVELAQAVFAALVRWYARQTEAPALVLVHSRFRPTERSERMDELLEVPPAPGSIAVATQVVEAGVDLSSAVLATETAPFSAMVQRLGRCNRTGEEDAATVLWLDRGMLDARASAPYAPEDLAAARAAFLELEGASASPSRLEHLTVGERRETSAVLRRRDLVDLFDTAPDLSGSDVDVAPYIRDDDERTVSVFFRALRPLDPAVIGRESAAARDELVAVPVGALEKRTSWAFDAVEGEWRRLRREERARPGSTVMLDAEDGGYDARLGWTGRAADLPSVLMPSGEPEPAFGTEEPNTTRSWVTLEAHLTAAAAAGRALANGVELESPLALAVEEAAALHDVGKALPPFQTMLLSSAPEESRARLRETVWAKSAHSGGRHERPHFRHELVSALALGRVGPDGGARVDELVRYLVAAHHGRVRLSIRPAPVEERPKGVPGGARFALGVADGDVLPAQPTPRGQLAEVMLDLSEMELGGGERSWTALACDLLDTHGPFALGYLEALVRIADWRASA